LSTKDWKLRVFSFFLALIEVNARLALAFFTRSNTMNQLEFRRKLAKELLDFSFAMPEIGRERSQRASAPVTVICGLETAPPYAVSWTGTKWEFLKCKYPQHVCKTLGCQKKIRPIVDAW
jgi:hypothetical protein